MSLNNEQPTSAVEEEIYMPDDVQFTKLAEAANPAKPGHLRRAEAILPKIPDAD